MKRKTSPPQAGSQVITLPQPALTVGAGSAEKVYAQAFNYFFSTLLADCPAGDALKVQLLHYLPDTSYGNRDVLGWTLSGALVGLLAHSVGGEHARELHRTREQGMITWMPILVQLVEPWDALILAHTVTTGWRLIYAEPVGVRVAWWEHHDGKKFEDWTARVNTAARIQRQQRMAPLSDPLFGAAARTVIGELKVMLGQLRKQSLANQKPPSLVQFFEQQAERNEFAFLSDPHTLGLWLEFVKRNPAVFFTKRKSPGDIFDLFQSSLSGHDPGYVGQQRSRG
jgi:hypothetical protein